MQTYRFRFDKRGDLRFISHLDLSHAFERAARRAALPLAFTQGFHPHPRIAFATALSVGTTSEAEYVDLELTTAGTIEGVMQALNRCLPEGVCLTRGVVVPPSAKSLMASVDFASYRAGIACAQADLGRVSSGCDGLMAEGSIVVRKRTKSGWKDIDLRPLIRSLEASSGVADVEIAMVLASGSDGMAKPEDVLEALKLAGAVDMGASLTFCHRTGLYHEGADGHLRDLFDV